MTFSEKLRNLRKEKGMSQEDLAEVLGVSRQAVSKWESGQSYPEIESLIALGELFGVTLDSFMKETDLQKDAENHISEPFWLNRGRHYEYKSKKTLFGIPLVHVNIGRGMKKAKGIVAVGNIAQGLVSVGLVSMGLVSFGILSLGLIGLGILAVGLLMAIAPIAIGTFSIGAIAIGIFTLGAVSVGMFSFGALSVASHIAIGDHAYGPIAVGRVAEGVRAFVDTSPRGQSFTHIDTEEVRRAIFEEYPNMWNWVVNYMTGFLR